MNKVNRLGMLFNEGNVPDFGSIKMKSNNKNIYYLLAQDIPKLNGMLTKAAAAAYLPEEQSFNFYTGALAFVVDYKTADSGKIYAYHRGQDHWYEFNIRSDLGLWYLMCNRHKRILRETKTIDGTPPLAFRSNGRPLKNYRIYGNTVNGMSVGDLVTEGEHTGEYCVPVTITDGIETHTANLYLPEQIRKVGDEVEYVDYKKQKQYRVRKNLWNENYTDIPVNLPLYKSIYVGEGKFTLSTTAPKNANDAANIFLIGGMVNTGGNSSVNGAWLDNPTTVTAIDGYITIAFRSQYGVNPADYLTQIEHGQSATNYEPYIENTELDVTVPALITNTGTNIMTVETIVQPSTIEIKGTIKN